MVSKTTISIVLARFHIYYDFLLFHKMLNADWIIYTNKKINTNLQSNGARSVPVYNKIITVYNFVKNYFFLMRFFCPFSLSKHETNTENRIEKYSFLPNLQPVIVLK